VQTEYSKKFIKEFKKCPAGIREDFKLRLKIFIDNQYHPLLNNHPLQGKLKGCRSINITGDWRAIFEEIDEGQIVHFVAIGTHSQLYS
jgi:addiction module RelE/StbE family toxin